MTDLEVRTWFLLRELALTVKEHHRTIGDRLDRACKNGSSEKTATAIELNSPWELEESPDQAADGQGADSQRQEQRLEVFDALVESMRVDEESSAAAVADLMNAYCSDNGVSIRNVCTIALEDLRQYGE